MSTHQWLSGFAVDRRCRVQPPVALIDLSRSDFSVIFLRNSRKYGLGSLGKTPYGGHSPQSPRTLELSIGLILTTQPNFLLQFNRLSYCTITPSYFGNFQCHSQYSFEIFFEAYLQGLCSPLGSAMDSSFRVLRFNLREGEVRVQ